MSPLKRVTVAVLWLLAIGVILEVTTNLFFGRTIEPSGEFRQIDFDSMKQVALALRTYCGEHGGLPPAFVTDKNGKPLYSLRVLILPYINRQELYSEFHLDEPWDSPANIKLLRSMPSEFAISSQQEERDRSLTRFRVIVGPGRRSSTADSS